MKVALFVEGSLGPGSTRGGDPLERAWNQDLARALGVAAFSPIVGISKRDLVAMDPCQLQISGNAEGLAKMIARRQRLDQFEAAVVAWDLVPRWDPNARCCRRDEVLRFYGLLALEPNLPQQWQASARRRHQEVSQGLPAARPLGAGVVLAVCMEPMFETLLVQNEQALRAALGLAGTTRPAQWPTAGWGPTGNKPDETIDRAIRSLRQSHLAPAVVRKIKGDYLTDKSAWSELLLRLLLDHPGGRTLVINHPLGQRLAQWLAPAPPSAPPPP